MPTLPKYINAMIMLWAAMPSTGVIFAVNPTVQMAETASNQPSRKLTGATEEMKIPPNIDRATVIKVMVMASTAFPCGIFRLKTWTVSLPLALAQINSSSTSPYTELIDCDSCIIDEFYPANNTTCCLFITANITAICTYLSKIKTHATTKF